jgi:hypothetical protein
MEEAHMAGVLDKFYAEYSIHGARATARTLQLTPGCRSDSEIDTYIQMLKDDLDLCAKDMKRLITLNNRGALFEGWPKAGDSVLDG